MLQCAEGYRFSLGVHCPRARGWSGSIFHGSSTFGTYLAVAAGTFVVPVWGWQRAFLLGAAPALLTLWIRWNLREPEQWTAARSQAPHPGPEHARHGRRAA